MNAATNPARQAFIDQVRGLTTLVVVLHHTAITYGGAGGWYFRDRAGGDGGIAPLLLSLMCAVDQAWFMGAFFLFAGYFTPPAYERKGTARFFRERAMRLGIPLLLYAFFIDALTNAIADVARGEPFLRSLGERVAQLHYGPGPLWFVQALLVLAVAFALWRRLGRGTLPSNAAFPSNATLSWAAVGVALSAFLVRLLMPVGSEWWHWQLGYFPAYVLLFVVGCAAAGPQWLAHIDAARARLWMRTTLIALPVLPVLAIAWPSAKSQVQGGFNGPAMVYAMWEPFVAWGVILGLLWFFRSRVQPGRLANLSRRAYAIYCFHPPVVVGVSVALHGWAAPPLLKFAVVGALSCMALYGLCGLVLRIPGASRIW